MILAAHSTSGSQKLTVLRKRHNNNLFFEADKNKDTTKIALASSNNCWFSHDVTKFQTSELLILLRFYFHDVLEQLKTNIQKYFHSEWVLGLVIDYA